MFPYDYAVIGGCLIFLESLLGGPLLELGLKAVGEKGGKRADRLSGATCAKQMLLQREVPDRVNLAAAAAAKPSQESRMASPAPHGGLPLEDLQPPPADAVFVVPTLHRLLTVVGTRDKPAANVTIRGLGFALARERLRRVAHLLSFVLACERLLRVVHLLLE